MNELPLPSAIHRGIFEVNRLGTPFQPSLISLAEDFSHHPIATSGVIALASERGGPQRDRKGYELAKFAVPDIAPLEATVGDLWECTKEHYGLTTSVIVGGAGGIPITKTSLGHHVAQGSSKYTNLVSHFGVKFFPMARLPNGSLATRVARSTFGTIRVFGIIGRAMPFVAVGLAVFDVISIGKCVYEAWHGK